MVGNISKEDAIKLAVEKLKSFKNIQDHSGGTGGSNASYGSVSTLGDVKFHHHPCHAFMKAYKDSFVVFSKYITAPTTKNIADKYRQFLMTGPWKELFDRFYYDETSQGFINPHPEKTPANLQHNFLVASRAISEWPHNIVQWDYLTCKLGINPTVAFWFLSVFNDHIYSGNFPKPGQKDGIAVPKACKYDWALDVQTYSDDAFFRFVNHKPENFNHMYSTNPIYTPVNAIWGKSTTIQKNLYIYQLEQRYGKTHGKTTKRIDTYSTDWSVMLWNMSYDEMIDIIRQEEKRVLTEGK